MIYLSILLLPLLGSIVSGFLGRKVGVTGAHIVTCSCLVLASILASVAFYEVGLCGSPVHIYLANWLDSDYITITWEFLFDQVTVSMMIPVLYISSLIHLFSTDYMSEDPAKCCGETFIGYKLSNSGDTLKLMVPSFSRKVTSGWSNDPCTVISHKMMETAMGYRGSKSVLVPSNTVKEQRVDGSWFIKPKLMNLRCTLMGFERNYPVKIPSKQLNVRTFSTLN